MIQRRAKKPAESSEARSRAADSPRPSPRKAPRQDRSRALVDALLVAATRILVRDGWGALTTNRVAAEAGVSVGSLYQYFPHKDAIVVALVRQVSDEMAQDLTRAAQGLKGLPIEEGVRRIVAAAIEATRKDAALHRELLNEIPRLGALELYEQIGRRVADVLAEWIASEPRLAVEDPSLAAYVLVTSLDALTDHALFFRPELLESPRFAAALERMVAGVLGIARTSPPRDAPSVRRPRSRGADAAPLVRKGSPRAR